MIFQRTMTLCGHKIVRRHKLLDAPRIYHRRSSYIRLHWTIALSYMEKNTGLLGRRRERKSTVSRCVAGDVSSSSSSSSSRCDKDCFHHLTNALHLSLCCESDVHVSVFMSLSFRFLLMVSLNQRRGRPLFL